MTQEKQSGPITFMNQFTLDGSSEAFEKAFAESADFLRRQSGCRGYTLYQRLDGPGRYVNIAVWDDADSLRKAVSHPDFSEHAKALRALATSDGGMYTERLAFAPEKERPPRE